MVICLRSVTSINVNLQTPHSTSLMESIDRRRGTNNDGRPFYVLWVRMENQRWLLGWNNLIKNEEEERN